MDEDKLDKLVALQEELIALRDEILDDIRKEDMEEQADILPDFVIMENAFIHFYMCRPLEDCQRIKEILDLEIMFNTKSPEIND